MARNPLNLMQTQILPTVLFVVVSLMASKAVMAATYTNPKSLACHTSSTQAIPKNVTNLTEKQQQTIARYVAGKNSYVMTQSTFNQLSKVCLSQHHVVRYEHLFILFRK